jgi:hypothetical protein
MNGREYFHESVVRDVVDVLTSMKDFDEVQFINNAKANRSFKSITSATKDLILTFPVMVSTDIEPDNAIMIAKAQEKKMASLLHILFTAISVDNNEDVFDYVKKFHSNMGSMSGSLDDYIDSMDRLATAYGEAYEQTMKIDHAVLNSVLEDLKESNYVLPDDVKESSLESYKIIPGYATGRNDMIINEAKPRNNNFNDLATQNNYNGNSKNVNADTYKEFGRGSAEKVDSMYNVNRGGVGYVGTQDNSRTTINHNYADEWETRTRDQLANLDAMEKIGTLTAQDKAKRETLRRELNDYLNNKRDSLKLQGQNYTDRYNKNAMERNLDMAKYMADMTKAHNAVVLNNEYKKANELQPTMMVINFMKHSDENGDFINTAVIGIKCKIYAVSSADICNRVSGKLEDKSVLTNFIRATTNEIAFFRDFLFAVDRAKFDAKSYGKRSTSNKMWKVLERRSIKSKFRRSLKMYNDATAITTLVLSENDNEYLKKTSSIDLLNVAAARKILDAYNFMCIVIANQSTEVASFLYDTGDDTYEMIPFSGLEREASDNSYKKMVNLMSKIAR